MKLGDKSARLTMISEPYTTVIKDTNVRMAMFECECGTQLEIRLASVNARLHKSCGCLRNDRSANKGTLCKCCGKRKLKGGLQTVCTTCKERYE